MMTSMSQYMNIYHVFFLKCKVHGVVCIEVGVLCSVDGHDIR
jgi:hypothetical protein